MPYKKFPTDKQDLKKYELSYVLGMYRPTQNQLRKYEITNILFKEKFNIISMLMATNEDYSDIGITVDEANKIRNTVQLFRDYRDKHLAARKIQKKARQSKKKTRKQQQQQQQSRQVTRRLIQQQQQLPKTSIAAMMADINQYNPRTTTYASINRGHPLYGPWDPRPLNPSMHRTTSSIMSNYANSPPLSPNAAVFQPAFNL